jgi:hypothetical protein
MADAVPVPYYPVGVRDPFFFYPFPVVGVDYYAAVDDGAYYAEGNEFSFSLSSEDYYSITMMLIPQFSLKNISLNYPCFLKTCPLLIFFLSLLSL